VYAEYDMNHTILATKAAVLDAGLVYGQEGRGPAKERETGGSDQYFHVSLLVVYLERYCDAWESAVEVQ